jgi:hypothetical protein
MEEALQREIELLKEEIIRLREQIHRERNEATVQYGNYERRLRDLKQG